MKLLGLDFETANDHAGSICSIGLALVENDAVVDSRTWLIRPHRTLDWMQKSFTEIHGIFHDDLREAPEFPVVWSEMAAFLRRGDCIVIHNANFDLSQLKAVLQLYNLSSITFPYICSLHLSRKHFKQMKSHRLNDMAAYFGYTFHHHNALEDAMTCARIAGQIGIADEPLKTFTHIGKSVPLSEGYLPL